MDRGLRDTSDAVPPAGGPPVTDYPSLELGRRLGPAVWLARADGVLVATRVATAAVFDPGTEDGDAGHDAASMLAGLVSPHLVPLLGLAEQDDATWLVSAYVEGVSLTRLIGAATLTPVQAGFLAIGVVRGLLRLHQAGLAHGRLTGDNVLVRTDGEPTLTDWAPGALAGARDAREAAVDDVAAMQAMALEVARNADRPVVRHHAAYDELMAALEHPVEGEDMAGLHARLEQALLSSVGNDTGMAGPRAEIARLVTTLARRRSPNGHREVRGLRVPIPVPEVLPEGRLSEADWRRAGSGPWLWRAAVPAVVLVVLAGAFVVGRGPVGDLLDGLGDESTSSSAPGPSQPAASDGPSADTSPSAGPTPAPVPSLAPSAAGEVSAVEIRPYAECTAGATCLLRTTARVTPSVDGRLVRFEVAVVNRCSGTVRTRPAGDVTAAPGWTSVYVTTSVTMPRAGSLAVVALTTDPARAASSPLLVPVAGGSC